jgi:hypothetical protein
MVTGAQAMAMAADCQVEAAPDRAKLADCPLLVDGTCWHF